MPEVKPATGTARYEDGKLTITTNAKRGKKIVQHAVVYVVEDIRPDPRVASPAFSLTKEDGEVYHVAIERYGPTCSCAHATFRGSNNRIPCKHIKACMAVGLLPKGRE